MCLRWLCIEAFPAASASSPAGTHSPATIHWRLLMMSLPHQEASIPAYLMLTWKLDRLQLSSEPTLWSCVAHAEYRPWCFQALMDKYEVSRPLQIPLAAACLPSVPARLPAQPATSLRLFLSLAITFRPSKKLVRSCEALLCDLEGSSIFWFLGWARGHPSPSDCR